MNDTRISQYLAARQAFGILTGAIDKDEQLAALRTGYAALASLKADGMSIRDIVAASGLSKGKVERDLRAADIMAAHPKVDPVTVVKACNIATATQLRKATATAKGVGGRLAELVREANKASRAARGRTLEQTDKDDKTVGAPRAPRASVTAADVVRFITRSAFTPEELDKIAQTATQQAASLRKAAQSVEKVA